MNIGRFGWRNEITQSITGPERRSRGWGGGGMVSDIQKRRMSYEVFS